MKRYISPWVKIDAGPSQEILRRMRADGLTWEQIGELVGSDRMVVSKLMHQGQTIGLMAERIRAGWLQYERYGPPQARRIPGDYTRFMLHCLEAKGWTSTWIANQTGRDVQMRPMYPTVFRGTETAVAAVFAEYRDQWGPSRQAMLRSWRNGYFPADCYEWEEGDYRPIPGSFHHERVAEALTFTKHVTPARAAEIRDSMHALGQWESERCARASMAAWAQLHGYPAVGGSRCQNSKHDHGLPAAWREDVAA